jgi:hypothetical protein
MTIDKKYDILLYFINYSLQQVIFVALLFKLILFLCNSEGRDYVVYNLTNAGENH